MLHLSRYVRWWFVALALAVVAPRPAAAVEPPPSASNLWFAVGEELVYAVYWGVIYVAETRVTTEWVEHEGRTVLGIRYRTRGNAFIEKIYPVNDFIESLIDPETFLPIRFTKTLNEGGYHTDEITDFDFTTLTAHWQNRKNGKTKDFPIESDTRDLVTFTYFLRSRSFTPGEKLSYRIMADEKLYDIMLKVGQLDVMKFDRFGKVRSMRVEPEAAFEGIFVRKGRITLWVSEDPRRVCTRMMATVPVANIRINLAEVRGPGNDFWVRGGKRADARTEEAPEGGGLAAHPAGEEGSHVD